MCNLIYKIAAAGLVLGMSSASVPAMADTPEFEECILLCEEFADGNQQTLSLCIDYCFREFHPEY